MKIRLVGARGPQFAGYGSCHSNPFNLLVGGISSLKIVTLVNKIIEVKQIIPIKIRQIKQFTALNDGLSGVMV